MDKYGWFQKWLQRRRPNYGGQTRGITFAGGKANMPTGAMTTGPESLGPQQARMKPEPVPPPQQKYGMMNRAYGGRRWQRPTFAGGNVRQAGPAPVQTNQGAATQRFAAQQAAAAEAKRQREERDKQYWANHWSRRPSGEGA